MFPWWFQQLYIFFLHLHTCIWYLWRYRNQGSDLKIFPKINVDYAHFISFLSIWWFDWHLKLTLSLKTACSMLWRNKKHVFFYLSPIKPDFWFHKKVGNLRWPGSTMCSAHYQTEIALFLSSTTWYFLKPFKNCWNLKTLWLNMSIYTNSKDLLYYHAAPA